MAVTVPTLPLNDGRHIPQLGFGCWQLSDAQAPELVGHALEEVAEFLLAVHDLRSLLAGQEMPSWFWMKSKIWSWL